MIETVVNGFHIVMNTPWIGTLTGIGALCVSIINAIRSARTSKKANQIAEEALDTAKDALDTAKKDLDASVRPLLKITPENKRQNAYLNVKNVGNGPAKDIELDIKGKFKDRNAEDCVKLDILEVEAEKEVAMEFFRKLGTRWYGRRSVKLSIDLEIKITYRDILNVKYTEVITLDTQSQDEHE